MRGNPEPEHDIVTVHTADSIAELVTENIESPTAEDVLKVLQRLNGKPITTRLLDHLPGGRVEWRLSRSLGWTEIRNRTYINSNGAHRDAICLMLVKSEASEPLDAAWVESQNPAYFADRRERNALRAKALANRELLERMALLCNEIEVINAERARVRQQFAVFVLPGEPLSPDRFALERAVGLREDTK